MDTERLGEFIAVVNAGSMNRAARELSCSQSMLSKHIASLETFLGCTLLVRGKDGVKPTAAGRAVYVRAARVLYAVSEMRAAAAAAGAEGTARGDAPGGTSGGAPGGAPGGTSGGEG